MRGGVWRGLVLVLCVVAGVVLVSCSGSDAGNAAPKPSAFVRWNKAFSGGDRDQVCDTVDSAFLEDLGYGSTAHPSVAGPVADRSTAGSRLVSCQWNGTAPQQVTLGAQQYASAASLLRTVTASRKKMAGAKSTATAHITALKATAHGMRASETDQGPSGSVSIESCSQWSGRRELYLVVTALKPISLTRVCNILARSFDLLAT